MLTQEQALERLEEILRNRGRYLDGGLVVMREYTIPRPYGWIFKYTSKKWLETRSIRHAIAGNGPVVIIAATGEVVDLGTALPMCDSLAKFERQRGLESAFWDAMRLFTKTELETQSPPDRATRCHALGHVLATRLAGAGAEFHVRCYALVAELRALGHDLWSFDQSLDFEVWCPNYVERSGPGIVVTFRIDEEENVGAVEVEVDWSEQ